jgi:hypothetical protein
VFPELENDMDIDVKWKKARWRYSETQVLWDADEQDFRINPGRIPTVKEASACPKSFTCFACGEKHPVRELGGRYHEKWFCEYCIEFVDEWTAGAMVWWEKKRHPRSGKESKPSPPNTMADRIDRIVDVVAWAIEEGYPVL